MYQLTLAKIHRYPSKERLTIIKVAKSESQALSSSVIRYSLTCPQYQKLKTNAEGRASLYQIARLVPFICKFLMFIRRLPNANMNDRTQNNS